MTPSRLSYRILRFSLALSVLFASLLINHRNASAIVTTDAYPVAVFDASTLNGVTTSGDCLGINGGVYAGSNLCNLYHFNITGISSPFQVADKDIIMVRAIVANNAQNDAVDVSGGGNVYGEINGAILTIVDFSYYQLSNSQGMATWAFLVNGDSTINGPLNLKTVTGQQIFTIFPGEGIQSGGINVYRTTVKSTDRIINSVEAINSAIASALQNQVDIKNWVIEVTDRQDDQKQYLQTIEQLLRGISQNSDAGQVLERQRQEDEDNLNQAQEDADTAGSDSSAEADTQGQSLLQAFISFVGAITNASPSNCNINGNMGRMNLGTINLCAISPPPAFQVISSIVVIGFCVPLSMAAASKMVSLFRSFQG